jgi:NAD(P)-dependent dehydrogenase (short-subunit alcohol dehydrogenase family)
MPARLAGMATRLPGRRLGQPDDIANAVSFLIGDSLITGTVLHAEGAQLLVLTPFNTPSSVVQVDGISEHEVVSRE